MKKEEFKIPREVIYILLYHMMLFIVLYHVAVSN